MKIPNDPDTWFLVLVAMRYCIGRRSYAPALCADWIKRHWRDIPEATKVLLRRDLSEEIERAERLGLSSLGDKCDQETWLELAVWMTLKSKEQTYA